MWFFPPCQKTKQSLFSPLSLVLNNLWEGASAPSFEDYSNLNDLTCPFLSFIPSQLFLPSCSTLSCSSVCPGRGKIRALTFLTTWRIKKYRTKSRPRCLAAARNVVPEKTWFHLSVQCLHSSASPQPNLFPGSQSFLIVPFQGLWALNNGDPTSSLALGSLLPASSWIFPWALAGQAVYI